MSYIEIGGKRHRYYVLHGKDSIAVWLDGRTYYLPKTKRTNSVEHAGGSNSSDVVALMPGKLLSIEVQVGDTVAEKQTVAIMESMKMESPLYAPKAGRVAEVRCQPGQVVDVGEVIVVIS
jgi:biotin carboxyl carrier protein